MDVKLLDKSQGPPCVVDLQNILEKKKNRTGLFFNLEDPSYDTQRKKCIYNNEETN